jgi:hypothetical protein
MQWGHPRFNNHHVPSPRDFIRFFLRALCHLNEVSQKSRTSRGPSTRPSGLVVNTRALAVLLQSRTLQGSEPSFILSIQLPFPSLSSRSGIKDSSLYKMPFSPSSGSSLNP